jgi:hypothetical protein
MKHLYRLLLLVTFNCMLSSQTIAQFDTTNLLFWLRADTSLVLNGNAVTAWNDVSNNNFNFASNSNPTKSIYSGFDCVSFNANLLTSIANTSFNNYNVFVVYKKKGNTIIYERLIDHNFSNGFWIGRSSNILNSFGGGYKNNAPPYGIFGNFNDADFNILRMSKNGINHELFNGKTLIASQVLTNNAGTQLNPIKIGGEFATSSNFEGDIFDIIVFKDSISNTKANTIVDYLYNKYSPQINLGPNIAITTSLCDTLLVCKGNFISYLWSTGDTTKSITATISGKYWLKVEDVFKNIKSDTINVTLSPNRIINLPKIINVCKGSLINLNTLLSKNTYAFLWNNGSTDSLLSITQAGKYALKITDAAGCYINSDTIIALIDSFALKASLGPDTALCIGNSLYLKKGAAANITYAWNNGLTTPSIPINNGGQYTITATNINNCIAHDTINITLLGNAPTVNFSYNNNCVGNTVAFTNLSAPPSGATINGVKWTVNNNATTYASLNLNYTFNDTLTQQLKLETTASNGCSNFIVKNVKIYAQPQVSISHLNSCNNATTVIKATPVLNGTTLTNYTWSSTTIPAFTTIAPTINQPLVNAGTTAFNVILTTTIGCTATATKNIYTYPAPSVNFSTKNNCDSNIVVFKDVSNYYGPYTVLSGKWIITGIDSALYNNYYYKQLPKGSYNATLNVIASNGCKGSITKAFNVHALPKAKFAISNNCNNYKALLSYVTTANNAPISSYSWIVDSTHTYTGANVQHQLGNSNDSIVIKISVVDTNNCVGIYSSKTPVLKAPKALFTNDLSPNYNLPTTLKLTNASTNASEYNWVLNNDVTTANTSTNYTYNATTDGVFDIKLTANNTANCKDSTIQRLELSKRRNDVMISNLVITESNNYATANCLITNLGTRILTNLELYTQVAGNEISNEQWQGKLAIGESVLYSLKSKAQINTLKNYNNALCVWATTVNDFTDEDPNNNKACVALSNAKNFELSTTYQNPQNKTIVLTVISKNSTTAHLIISDANGKIVLNNPNLNLNQVITEINIDLSKLATGVYNYSIDNGSSKLVGRFFNE